MEQRNIAKAQLLYDAIDQSSCMSTGWQKLPLAHERAVLPARRIPQRRLPGRRGQRGLLQLKGHKSVGGMRASIYNAMPLEGVQALVDYMREFEQTTPEPPNPAMPPTLPELRVQIDASMQQLLALLNQRAAAGQRGRRGQAREGSPCSAPSARRRSSTACRSQPRAAEGRACGRPSGAKSCRPACAGSAAARGRTWGRPAPSASRRIAVFRLPASTCALRQLRRGVPRHRPGSAQFRRGAGGENSPKAWSRARSTCSCTPLHVVGESACWCATTCCVRVNSLDGIEAVLRPPAGAGPMPGLAVQAPAHAERRAVSSNAEGARLASHQPGLGRHCQRACGQPVRPAHRGPRHPGRRLQPHPLCRHLPAADAGHAAAFGQRLHQPDRVGAQQARVRCTTCWCRSRSMACP
jgi:hypothetical protein